MIKEKGEILTRPPVVVIVGHVDHGKTTLLDSIRKEDVAGSEKGGITQAVGAYEVEHKDKKITFIDTPGHEAFTMMRTQGTAVADIAVLIVAADDGVKLQTKEAIKILQSTKTPFVVAITKIDTEGADIEKVKGELMEENVLLEGAGGDISWQAVSSKTGEGINDLLSLILLVAEIEELTYDTNARANGFILESQKDKNRGILGHLIIKDGVLCKGDEIVTQTVSGKIKILEDYNGKAVKELYPSSPASVGNFDALPKNGEEFWAGRVDIKVVGVSAEDGNKNMENFANALTGTVISSDDEFSDKKLLKAVINADSIGALEALRQILLGIVDISRSSVGEISEGDIQFAKSTDSIVLGFRVKESMAAKLLAESQNIKVFSSDIIYRITEKVEEFEKEMESEDIRGGKLEVLAVFSSTQSKQTIGGRVLEGVMGLNAPVQIMRGEEILGRGRIKNLQEGKEDIKEVMTGKECGIVLSTDIIIEVGDIISIIK